MKYCTDKNIDKLIRRLIRQGWLFYRGGKHGRLRHPNGRPTITVPSSPGDYRSFQNFRRDLRKACSQVGRETQNPHGGTQVRQRGQ